MILSGLDITRVPPHTEVLPSATFSEPMSSVAKLTELFTGTGWLTCPCNPEVNALCNECPGAGVLGLHRSYRDTYLSSGTYCSYATRDLSGEPLTPWPGSTTPGDDSRTYTTSKVRIEEPAVNIGGTFYLSHNPLSYEVVSTSDIDLSQFCKSFSVFTPFVKTDPLSLSGSPCPNILTLPNGLMKLSGNIFLPEAGKDYKIIAAAPNTGEDFINVHFDPIPRQARVYIPFWILREILTNHAKIVPNFGPTGDCIGSTLQLDPAYSSLEQYLPNMSFMFPCLTMNEVFGDYRVKIYNYEISFDSVNHYTRGDKIHYDYRMGVTITSGEVIERILNIRSNLAGDKVFKDIEFSGDISLFLTQGPFVKDNITSYFYSRPRTIIDNIINKVHDIDMPLVPDNYLYDPINNKLRENLAQYDINDYFMEPLLNLIFLNTPFGFIDNTPIGCPEFLSKDLSNLISPCVMNPEYVGFLEVGSCAISYKNLWRLNKVGQGIISPIESPLSAHYCIRQDPNFFDIYHFDSIPFVAPDTGYFKIINIDYGLTYGEDIWLLLPPFYDCYFDSIAEGKCY